MMIVADVCTQAVNFTCMLVFLCTVVERWIRRVRNCLINLSTSPHKLRATLITWLVGIESDYFSLHRVSVALQFTLLYIVIALSATADSCRQFRRCYGLTVMRTSARPSNPRLANCGHSNSAVSRDSHVRVVSTSFFISSCEWLHV